MSLYVGTKFPSQEINKNVKNALSCHGKESEKKKEFPKFTSKLRGIL